MPEDYNPGQSILETYIQARKDRLDRAHQAGIDATNKANVDSEVEFRKNESANTIKRLQQEHDHAQHQFDIDNANLKIRQMEHELASKKAIHELGMHIADGTIPAPPQQFTPNGQQNPTNTPQIPGVNLPAGNFSNSDIDLGGGQTLKGSEYFTPEQAIKARQPIVDQTIKNAAANAGAISQATEQGKENVYTEPGGKYEQERTLEDRKLQNDIAKAKVTGLFTLQSATIRANATKAAAAIRASSSNKLDDDQVSSEAQQASMGLLKLTEGPTGRAARATLLASGLQPVDPKVRDNLKALGSLEDLSTQMDSFSNKYLSTKLVGRTLNYASAHLPTDLKTDLDNLKVQATQFAKAVESASGRVLASQIKQAVEFLSDPTITPSQMKTKIDFLKKTTTHAVDMQLGNLAPKQKVQILINAGLPTYASEIAEKYGLQDKTVNPNHISNIPGAVEIK